VKTNRNLPRPAHFAAAGQDCSNPGCKSLARHKSEGRIPRSERSPKAEIRRPDCRLSGCRVSGFGFRISFGFRPSSFGLCPRRVSKRLKATLATEQAQSFLQSFLLANPRVASPRYDLKGEAGNLQDMRRFHDAFEIRQPVAAESASASILQPVAGESGDSISMNPFPVAAPRESAAGRDVGSGDSEGAKASRVDSKAADFF
jgi:hypothetical protein